MASQKNMQIFQNGWNFNHRFNRLVVILCVITLLHRYIILNIDFAENFAQVYYNPANRDETKLAWWLQNRDAMISGISTDILFVL
ncbi:MAG: hypothetical protein LJE68_02410, partial [Rhodobacter sp.]|nr:hypothetical protein [Rhodobacter sp.]